MATTDVAPGQPAGCISIRSCRIYRGPNLWSYEPAAHFVLNLGELENYPSHTIPGFVDRLLEHFPGLQRHTCSRGVEGGFVQRLREGTWLGHVTEHLALQLQQEAGHDVRRGKTRQLRGADGELVEGVYNVVFAFLDEAVGQRAGELAVRLVNYFVDGGAASGETDFDVAAELERWQVFVQRKAFGPSTQAIIDEAVSRDIPFTRLNGASLVQLGQGVHAQRIRATMTSRTSALAVDIAGDKNLTASLLGSAGLPVPSSDVVRTKTGALEAARRVGYPVVVKPLDGNHGRGVCLNLTSDADVAAAFDVAYAQSRRGRVQVESYITGRDYRFLIIDGKLAACAERVPAHVVGDGHSTISHLIETTNADPRRGIGHEKVLTKIKVDEAALALLRDQGYTLDSVPAADEIVKLAATGNMSTGGISIDRTLDAHPDNVEIAEEAARLVGLDVAGIDFICPDITLPAREVGGAICEVNAAPGFRMHTHPTIGEPQFIAKPVVDLLFPPGASSRVPIVGVTGTNGKTTTSRMLAHIMKGLGKKVGMTSTDGIVVDERLVIKADASGPKSARMVLQNPRVDFAVLEVARGGILREGLGYDRNDIAVVTNIASDHLGRHGLHTLQDLARVKSVVVEAVPRHGFAVLNADDPYVRGMRRKCRGSIVWFSMDAPGSRVRQFIDERCVRGERAVVLEPTDRGEMIVLKQGRRSMQLAWTHLLPSTFNGTARMNVANALAAAGAAFAAGAPLHDIRNGLRTFTTSYYLSPGRLNHIEVQHADVFVDYCHNPAGMEKLGEFINAYTDAKTDGVGRRRLVVIGAAGDRRDEDIRELGQRAAEAFDVVIAREDANLRRRPAGQAAQLLADGARQAAAQGGRARHIHVIPDELEATRAAVDLAEPGDVVAVCADHHGPVMALLEELTNMATPGAQERGTADPDFDPELDLPVADEPEVPDVRP